MDRRIYGTVTAFESGDSLVVVVPKDAVRDLGLKKGAELEVSAETGKPGLTYMVKE